MEIKGSTCPVPGGNQGLNLPSTLSQLQVNERESGAVISCSTTIFSLENFLTLMYFLCWIIQSGSLLHKCLFSLSLNLHKHFALTEVSQAYHHNFSWFCTKFLLALFAGSDFFYWKKQLIFLNFLLPLWFHTSRLVPLTPILSFQRDDIALLVLSAKAMGDFPRFDPSW